MALIRLSPRAKYIAVLGICFVTSVTVRASETGYVNGLGYGNARVSVTSPTPLTAVASCTGFNASAAIPKGQGAQCEAPLPGGANPGTTCKAFNGAFWSFSCAGSPVGGDQCCEPLNATPTSYSPNGSISVYGNQLSSTDVSFTITWSGSDPGVVVCIDWYDEGTSASLGSQARFGPWSETVTYTITAQSSAYNITISVSMDQLSTVTYLGPNTSDQLAHMCQLSAVAAETRKAQSVPARTQTVPSARARRRRA